MTRYITDWSNPEQLNDGILDIDGGEDPLLVFSGTINHYHDDDGASHFHKALELYWNFKDIYNEDRDYIPLILIFSSENDSNATDFQRTLNFTDISSGEYTLDRSVFFAENALFSLEDWQQAGAINSELFRLNTGINLPPGVINFAVINNYSKEDKQPPIIKAVNLPEPLHDGVINMYITPDGKIVEDKSESVLLTWDFTYEDIDADGTNASSLNSIPKLGDSLLIQENHSGYASRVPIQETGKNTFRMTGNITPPSIKEINRAPDIIERKLILQFALEDKHGNTAHYSNSLESNAVDVVTGNGIAKQVIPTDNINWTVKWHIEGAETGTFNLDVDGDGRVGAFSDGLMVIRKLLGASFNGDKLTDKAKAATATLSTSEIHDFIQAGIESQALDLDGDGKVDAFSDGLMLIRSMLGSVFNGEKLIDKALSPNSPYYGQADAWQSVKANIDALIPEQPVA